MELRSASVYSTGHIDEVDYISWNPVHPELFVTTSQKDKRLVFWDARRELHMVPLNTKPNGTCYRKSLRSAYNAQVHSGHYDIFT